MNTYNKLTSSPLLFWRKVHSGLNHGGSLITKQFADTFPPNRTLSSWQVRKWRYVTRISLINYWANLGINFGEEVLYDLGLNEAREIDLGHLSDVFCEQLSNCHQIIR